MANPALVATALLRGGVLLTDYSEQEMRTLLRGAGGSGDSDEQDAFHHLVEGVRGIERDVSGRTLDHLRFVVSRSRPLVGADTGPVGLRWPDRAGDRPCDDIAELAESGVAFLRFPVSVSPTSPAVALRSWAGRVRDCQRHGLLPVIEVDLRPGGDRNSLHVATARTTLALSRVITALEFSDVDITAVLLAARPVRPGCRSPDPGSPDDIARSTLDAVEASGARRLAGMLILPARPRGESHAMSANVAAIRRAASGWPIAYGLGRSLLGRVAALWRGRPDRVEDARRELRETFHLISTTLRASRL